MVHLFLISLFAGLIAIGFCGCIWVWNITRRVAKSRLAMFIALGLAHVCGALMGALAWYSVRNWSMQEPIVPDWMWALLFYVTVAFIVGFAGMLRLAIRKTIGPSTPNPVYEWGAILWLPTMLAFVVIMTGGLNDWVPLVPLDWRFSAFVGFHAGYALLVYSIAQWHAWKNSPVNPPTPDPDAKPESN